LLYNKYGNSYRKDLDNDLFDVATFKDKEIRVNKYDERAKGQEEVVANEPWYVYNANYGTCEEKKFVELFLDDLKD
jgi:hypothetical protein